ncbi:peptidylprolyl isomerase [Planctomycetota bacterium]
MNLVLLKKQRLLPALAILLVGVPLWGEEKVDPTGFKTLEEKVSYVIGTQFAGQLKSQGVDVQLDALLKGMREVLSGQACAYDSGQQQAILTDFRTKMTEQMKAKQEAAMGDNAWKTKLTKPEMMTFDKATDYFWILETNKGTITIKLMPDVAPMHVTSTIFLTNKGFYDDLIFHRVIPGFMAQGGCPLGTGTGGPGYKYAGETDPKVKHDKPYLLSMANAGPGTDGSQFFLTFVPTAHLNGKHTIFGEIVAGQDVMKKLEAAGTPGGTPKEKLVINKAKIEEKPKG